MENIFTELTAKIKVDVTKYKESLVDKSVIFYVIEIIKRGNEKWTLEKRFSEFDHMNKNLLKLFPKNLSPLPPKTVFKLVKPEDLEQRRQDLDKYLKGLVVRQDIFNSEPMRKFLNIENFAPEILVTPPKMIKEITNFLYGVRDFHYQRDQNILFALVSDMSVASRVDSYLSNMKMPWDSEDKPPCVSSVGVLECYIERKGETFTFDKLWSKGFAYQAICMVWDQASNLIVVGLDDGSVFCGKVSSETQYLKLDELLFFKIHENRVMGVGIDSLNNTIFSVGEDKALKVTSLTEHKTLFDCVISHTSLTALHYDKETKRIIVTNKNGNIFVYDVSKITPIIVQTLQTYNKNAIRGLYFDPVKNFVFTGSIDDGEICVFDIKKQGKEKLAKMEGTLKAKSEIRVLVWSNSRGEIYSGHKDGTISIWSLKKAGPIYVIKDSDKAITMLKWFEKDRLLFTGSKEKNIKIWEFPEVWRDQKIEEEEEFDEHVRRKTSAMLQYQKTQQKVAEDSDEDDISKIRF